MIQESLFVNKTEMTVNVAKSRYTVQGHGSLLLEKQIKKISISRKLPSPSALLKEGRHIFIL